MFDMATVAYVASPAFVMEAERLWAGRIKVVEVSKINAIDIDDPIDWEIAEYFLRKRLEGST